MRRDSKSLGGKPLIAEEFQWDWVTPVCLVVLSVMSVLFIRSAQAYGGGSYWKMQMLWCMIGFSVYGVVAWIDYHWWMRYSHLLYFAVIFALLLVFAGPVIYGARRWIDFGIFKIQPSEIAKWSTMVLGASILSRSPTGDMSESLKGIMKISACFGLPMFLIFYNLI